MSAHWSSRYVGIPYFELGRTPAGADCLGLLNLVYEAELGIVLPSYVGAYQTIRERQEIAGLLCNARDVGPWRHARLVQAFDVLIFRRGLHDSHIGIAIEPGLMLHSAEDHSKIETYSSGRWAPRLTGVYRHEAMIARRIGGQA